MMVRAKTVSDNRAASQTTPTRESDNKHARVRQHSPESDNRIARDNRNAPHAKSNKTAFIETIHGFRCKGEFAR